MLDVFHRDEVEVVLFRRFSLCTEPFAMYLIENLGQTFLRQTRNMAMLGQMTKNSEIKKTPAHL